MKNDHLGLEVPYRKQGIARRYIPDFIAVLDVGTNLVIEVKGKYTDAADIKAKAAERWVRAVNADVNYGRRQYEVVTDPASRAKRVNQLCDTQLRALDLVSPSVVVGEPR